MEMVGAFVYGVVLGVLYGLFDLFLGGFAVDLLLKAAEEDHGGGGTGEKGDEKNGDTGKNEAVDQNSISGAVQVFFAEHRHNKGFDGEDQAKDCDQKKGFHGVFLFGEMHSSSLYTFWQESQ